MKRQKYYAVASGRKPGIYKTWLECSSQVSGSKGSVFKSFSSLEEAKEYLDNDENSKKNIRYESSIQDDQIKIIEEITIDGDELHVYTDGACRGNGKLSARAGYGVYFGMNDPRNISAKLTGENQTNNRAELTAVIKAIEAVDGKKAVIHTDSMYCKNGIEKWMKNWKRRGWKTARGTDVLNIDLWKELDKVNDVTRISFRYVEAHVGILGNEMADELATKGAEM